MRSKLWCVLKRFILQIIIWIILWGIIGFIIASNYGGHASMLIPVLLSAAGGIVGVTYAVIMHLICYKVEAPTITGKSNSRLKSVYFKSIITGALSTIILLPYFYDRLGYVDLIDVLIVLIMGGISGLVSAPLSLKH